jgi:hypothetical protein
VAEVLERGYCPHGTICSGLYFEFAVQNTTDELFSGAVIGPRREVNPSIPRGYFWDPVDKASDSIKPML